MKWTIGTRILGGYAIALLAMLIIGAVAYRSISNLQAELKAGERSAAVLFKIEETLSQLKDAETGQRGFLITGKERYLEPHTSGVRGTRAALDELRQLTADNPAQQRRLAAIEPLVQSKFAELSKTIGLRTEQGFEAALQVVVTDEGNAAMRDIRALFAQMKKAEDDHHGARLDLIAKTIRHAFSAITFATLGAVVFMAIAGWLTARNIARPLSKITLAADRIAAGELDGEFAEDGREDEVGSLTRTFARMSASLREVAERAEDIAAGDLRSGFKPQSEKDQLGMAFAAMTGNLRGVMQDILEAVHVATAAAAEITASVSEVAAGAVETATSVAETTTTVEQVKHTAQLANEKVRAVAESAQTAADVSETGRDAVEATGAGMTGIRTQMDHIGASMVKLSEQTLAIGDIIASVNDLAEQSNILAVNASIEAAKAGEHGRGFGVVAQEVRTLAEQSKGATNQVRAILSDIQKATNAAMMATEQGSRAVDAGLQRSAQAGQAIATLTASFSQAAQTATQIAASSQQQVAGMDQVAIAIRSIQAASAQNAAAVKQIENSARDLKRLGEKLKDLVDRFKV